MKELVIRQNYLEGEIVNTIYFGGGTPSLLTTGQVTELLDTVRQNYNVSPDCEITFEANPDDLSEEYLLQLRQAAVNRLSIGIQSFNDDILKFLGRRHDSKKLNEIVNYAQRAGFGNISADLIFAIPGMNFEVYMDSLQKMIRLNIQHISAYSLTIEKGTYFYKLVQNNDLSEVSEEEMLRQFNATIDILSRNGFVQYEISNYAKAGFKSKHNCSYWENIKYLGIGPSAHSYNLVSRQWNISDTRKYCQSIEQSETCHEIEYLSDNDRFNEYLITGLRKMEGISVDYVNNNFNDKIRRHFKVEVDKLVVEDLISYQVANVALTRKGMLLSDFVVRQLYII